MASHSLGLRDYKVEALLQLDFPKASVDLVESFSNARDYYLHGKMPDFDQRLKSVRNESYRVQNQTLREIIQWSFWTLNHKDFDEVNAKVKSFLVSLPKTGEELRRRYLPQHITNLGHLAMLFLYINYYRKSDPSRIIVLPRIRSANDFFLDLILRHSPLKIEFADPEIFSKIPPTQIDTLNYSFGPGGKYRTEADCAFATNQEFPEFRVEDDFILKLNEDENADGLRIIESKLGRKVDSFFVLHVREPKNGDLKFSQARDANISKYFTLADAIEKSGSLVIRMGDKNFPKLDSNFPAFDYAHSNIKSEFMDVWLWANCKKWIGTVNGAAFPPIAFRKERVLLEQWYWSAALPAGDVGVKKKIIQNYPIKIEISHEDIRVSRCMDRAFIARSGYKLCEASSDELASEVSKII